MSAIRSQLDRYKSAQQDTADNVAAVPAHWPDFARQTWIRSSSGLQRFDPYLWQMELSEYIDAHSPRSLINLKSRQTGCSEYWLSKAAHTALSTPGITVLILGRTMQDSYLLGRRLRTMLEGSPWESDIDANALSHIVFSNKSSIIFRSHLPESVRGISAKLVIIDEAAFSDIGPLIEAVSSTQNMIDDPLLVLVSTPNGQHSHFYRLAQQSHPDIEQRCEECRSSNPFMAIPPADAGYHLALIHWKAIPRYASEDNFLERVQAEAGLSDASVNQEYELVSTIAESAVFKFELVRQAIAPDPLPESAPDKTWIGVDPSGSGKDYTAVVVLGRYADTYRVVDLYRHRTRTSEQDMAAVIDLIEQHQPQRVFIESNGVGQIFLDRIAAIATSTRVEKWVTTRQSKQSAIGRITLALERQQLQIPDGPIVKELLSFRSNGGKMEASGNAHDDTVLGLGIALSAANYGIERQRQQRPTADGLRGIGEGSGAVAAAAQRDLQPVDKRKAKRGGNHPRRYSPVDRSRGPGLGDPYQRKRRRLFGRD